MAKHWTNKEIESLKEKLPELGMAKFLAANLLDRSESAIEGKAIQLGLKGYCIDCEAEICPSSMRCNSCASKIKWVRGDMENVHNNQEWRQKQSEAKKAAWARGAYDDRKGIRGKRWLSKEIEVLTEKFFKLGKARFLAMKLLDRSQYAIENKAKELRLKNRCTGCGVGIWPASLLCHGAAMTSEVYRHKNSKSVRAAHVRGAYDDAFDEERRRKISEDMKAAWARGDYDGVFNEGTRRKQSEAMKVARARGDFDGVFQSPTKPERAVMAVLDFMGIEYNFNSLRLERYTYDFHLPDYNTLIEYDSWYWHYSDWATAYGTPERDKVKNALAQREGYWLIRLKGKRGRDLTGAEIWGRLSRALEGIAVK